MKILRYPKKIFNFYMRHKGLISPFSFLFGFVTNMLSQKRIDASGDNYILMAYMLAAGVLLIVLYGVKSGAIGPTSWKTKTNLIALALQFCMGNLYSAHVYFYFQSSAGLKSFLFIGGLFVLQLINEFYKEKFNRFYLQFAMYFLAVFSFFIFFLPVYTKEMSRAMFLYAGGISLGVTSVILALAAIVARDRVKRTFFRALGIMAVLLAVINLFYFMNWIPPVPMALRHSGIYHSLVKRGYTYELQYEVNHDWQFWRTSSSVYHYMPGDTVYCFTAIFSPTEINKTIYYQWQFYDKNKGWTDSDRQSYDLTGGREGGYRGYCRKTQIWPGEWRIDISTGDDILLGSVDFLVVAEEPGADRKLRTVLR